MRRLALICFLLISPPAAAERPLRVVVGGDVMPLSLDHAEGASFTWPEALRARLNAADAAIANLEGVIADAPLDARPCGPTAALCWRFRMPSSVAPALREAGFTALSLANNHANDFLAPGRATTREALSAAGLGWAGHAERPSAILTARDGRRIGFAAFAHNSGTADHRQDALVARVVSELAAQAQFVIVSLHGGAEGIGRERVPFGAEWQHGENRGDLRATAALAAASGAHLVFGHGPHVMRGAEQIGGTLVLYSLGNLWTGRGISQLGQGGVTALVEVELLPRAGFRCAAVISLVQRLGAAPVPDPQRRAEEEMRRLSLLDFEGSAAAPDEEGVIRRAGLGCGLTPWVE